jgi:hypothetical protein
VEKPRKPFTRSATKKLIPADEIPADEIPTDEIPIVDETFPFMKLRML